MSDAAHASHNSTSTVHVYQYGPGLILPHMLHCLPRFCRALGAVSDAAHASMISKLLDQYEQKDNLAQQLEAITKLEVGVLEGGGWHYHR